MLDKEDLQAIQTMLEASERRTTQRMEDLEGRMTQKMEDLEERMTKSTEERLDAFEARMAKSTAEQLEAFEERMTQKVAVQITAAEDRIAKNTITLMDAEFSKRFDALAEGQEIIREMLVPKSRVEELEDEVKFLRTIVRRMNEDIEQLKMAQ